jgi:hypothetical protein
MMDLLKHWLPQLLLGLVTLASWVLFIFGNAILLKAGVLSPEVAGWIEPSRWLWLGLGVLLFGLMFFRAPKGNLTLIIPTIIFVIAVGVGTVGQMWIPAQFSAAPQTPIVVEQSQVNFHPDDWVLGVTVDGVSKAYPWSLIKQQFVINDEVNGYPVVVMYCISCNSSLAFHSVYEGQTLSFGVVGEYHYETILHDEQTGNWWREDGSVIAGDMMGVELEMLPAALMSWRDWLELYPDTELAM